MEDNTEQIKMPASLVEQLKAGKVNLDGPATLQGQGNFFDERLNNAEQYPVAARAGLGNRDVLLCVVQAVNITAIAATILLVRRSNQICPYHLKVTETITRQ